MRCASIAVVVVLVAVSWSPVHAGTRRAGEVSADVTVRQRPEADAPKVADLTEGEPVIVQEKRQGWLRISGAARGWIPADTFAPATSESEQRRKLLTELAAAKSETADPEDRTDADLMYDAVKKWNGETPGAATIDRVLANSKKEADRSRRVAREKIKALFWKDPFSDQPHKLIAVRKEDRTLLASRADRRSQQRHQDTAESERLRTELATTRAELAAVRAELRAARAEIARGDSSPAKSEFFTSRTDTDTASDEAPSAVHRARRSGRSRTQTYETPPQRTERRRPSSRTALAAESTAPSVVAEAVPTPADSGPATPPPGWRSSDPRGIIIVPIEAPIPVRVDTKKTRGTTH